MVSFNVFAATYDCNLAYSFVEQEICKGEDLKLLDEEISKLYSTLITSSINKEMINDIKDSQEIWASSIKKCSNKDCLITLFKKRNSELCSLTSLTLGESYCKINQTRESATTSIYFAAENPPVENVPPEAPLCYKFKVSSIEEQLNKLKNKYPGLYDYKVTIASNESKVLEAKRKDENGNIISYFYSTDPNMCMDRVRQDVSKVTLATDATIEINNHYAANTTQNLQTSYPDKGRQENPRFIMTSSNVNGTSDSISKTQFQQSVNGEPTVQLVVTNGYGKDVPGAAQNAAHNALTQVVGSFIDAQKMLEKQIQIRDGVRTQVENIKTDIKEYSQGSIRSFEIVKIGEENGLTVVTAKVIIRIEELTTYVNEIIGGERQIAGTGLFAQAATKSQQKEDKVRILLDNVLLPLMGNIYEFEISAPKPYDSFEIQQELEILKRNGMPSEMQPRKGFPGHGHAQYLEDMASKYGKENIFLFDVIIKTNEDYIKNVIKSLSAISKIKEDVRRNARFLKTVTSREQKIVDNDDFIVILHDGKSSNLVSSFLKQNRDRFWYDSISTLPYTIYVVQDSIAHLRNLGEVTPRFLGCINQQGRRLSGYEKDLQIFVEFTDGDGKVLQAEEVNTEPFKAIAFPTDYTAHFDGNNGIKLGMKLYEEIFSGNFCGIGIIQQRQFKLVIAIDQEKLAKIEKMSLTFQDIH